MGRQVTMYYQICGTYDDENSIVGFELPGRSAVLGNNMQMGGICRHINDGSYGTSAWYINSNDNFVKFSGDNGTGEFTGTISIQGQFQYELEPQ